MSNSFAFIDESGVLGGSRGEQPFFGVGFLKVKTTAGLSDELTKKHYDFFSSQKELRKLLLNDLREKPRILDNKDINLLLSSTRHCEYKFTNINFTNLERYKSILDSIIKFPIHFCVIIIDKTDPLFNIQIYKNYWEAYITYTKLVCQHNIDPDEHLCVIADHMNKPNESNLYFETEINKIPKIFNTIRAHSETFTLLQTCDLLLGSVLFQWKASRGLLDKNSNRAKAKNEFTNYLISKLKMKGEYPLAQKTTIHSPIYFSIWPFRLKTTT